MVWPLDFPRIHSRLAALLEQPHVWFWVPACTFFQDNILFGFVPLAGKDFLDTSAFVRKFACHHGTIRGAGVTTSFRMGTREQR
eukprot:COSAG01_NODE_13132_length_1630_cov_27.598955_2_plen_84_part_00